MSPEHFIEFVKTEHESLRRFMLALCDGNSQEADDIAQEALVRAYVASGSFLGLSKFKTWLFRIAYNCYIDHLRIPRHESISTDTTQALNIPASDNTDDSFKHQRLYQALERLPEKEKAVIILHYFEDYSIKDIASIMQMPSGTVKYHLSIGRNHLKSLLQ